MYLHIYCKERRKKFKMVTHLINITIVLCLENPYNKAADADHAYSAPYHVVTTLPNESYQAAVL